MNKNTIARVATALFVVAIIPGAIMNIAQPEILVEMAGTLGVPLALMTLMGVWKLLGVAALLAPSSPQKLKEWAYAGFFFDLSGAFYLHIAAGDYANAPASLVVLALAVGSYVLTRRAGSDAATTAVGAPTPATA